MKTTGCGGINEKVGDEVADTQGNGVGQGGERDAEISVIVPVYNVRPYLDRCMESLLGQTFRDFELILVDDGSTDGSGERCDEWAEMDGRIRVFHQANAGQGAARNRAVRRSIGKWIAFVDADDYVAADYLEYLRGLALTHGADIAMCPNIFTNGEPLPAAEDDHCTVYERSEVCLKLQEGVLRSGPVCKLYRRELLEACPFPEGRAYEDTAIMGRLLREAQRVVLGARILYAYFVNPGSTTRALTPKKLRDQLWANLQMALFFEGVGEREAEALTWELLRKNILTDIKTRVLPVGELRAFWREHRGKIASWNVMGVKCRVALAAPWLYRLWCRLARK